MAVMAHHHHEHHHYPRSECANSHTLPCQAMAEHQANAVASKPRCQPLRLLQSQNSRTASSLTLAAFAEKNTLNQRTTDITFFVSDRFP